MEIYEDNCVGCPDGCRSCGRKHELVTVCDECGDYIAGKQYFTYEAMDLCTDCAFEYFTQELIERGYQAPYDNMDVDEMAIELDALKHSEDW